MLADTMLIMFRRSRAQNESRYRSRRRLTRIVQSTVVVVVAIILGGLQIEGQSWAAATDHLSTGIQQYKQGKYADAIRSLTAYAGANSGAGVPTAYYYMACCYYQSGRIEDAKRIYQTIARSFPKSPEAQTANAMLSRLSGTAGDTSATSGAQVASRTGASSPAGSASSGSQGGAIIKSSDADDDDRDPRYEAEYASLPQSTRIVFKRDEGGHMYVTVWLNNRPIRAIFDTGAHAHFGLNHLSQAGISVPANAKTSQAYGWAGKAVPIWLMDADLKMGDMKRRVPITVEENMALPPLVGQEFLKELRYEIDDKGGVMTLSKTRNNKNTAQFNSIYDVPCMHVSGDDMIPVEVQGKKTVAIIDTGAQSTILSQSTLAQLGIEIPPGSPVVSIGGVGGSTRCYVVELDLTVGPVRRQNFRTLVGGMAGNAIGQDFLQGWRYTVDHDRHLMRFFH